jgi:hypothetical protein
MATISRSAQESPVTTDGVTRTLVLTRTGADIVTLSEAATRWALNQRVLLDGVPVSADTSMFGRVYQRSAQVVLTPVSEGSAPRARPFLILVDGQPAIRVGGQYQRV